MLCPTICCAAIGQPAMCCALQYSVPVLQCSAGSLCVQFAVCAAAPGWIALCIALLFAVVCSASAVEFCWLTMCFSICCCVH